MHPTQGQVAASQHRSRRYVCLENLIKFADADLNSILRKLSMRSACISSNACAVARHATRTPLSHSPANRSKETIRNYSLHGARGIEQIVWRRGEPDAQRTGM